MNIVYIDVYLIETVSILTHLANIDIIAKESSMDSRMDLYVRKTILLCLYLYCAFVLS
jgi:hypothetical protein